MSSSDLVRHLVDQKIAPDTRAYLAMLLLTEVIGVCTCDLFELAPCLLTCCVVLACIMIFIIDGDNAGVKEEGTRFFEPYLDTLPRVPQSVCFFNEVGAAVIKCICLLEPVLYGGHCDWDFRSS